MIKKTIHITIKKDSPAAQIFQNSIKRKEEFRQTVEQITSARTFKERKPVLVRPV